MHAIKVTLPAEHRRRPCPWAHTAIGGAKHSTHTRDIDIRLPRVGLKRAMELVNGATNVSIYVLAMVFTITGSWYKGCCDG